MPADAEHIKQVIEKVAEACSRFSEPTCTKAICGTFLDIVLRDVEWISIRDQVIVGTPFGPDIPDGKYARIDLLNSAESDA